MSEAFWLTPNGELISLKHGRHIMDVIMHPEKFGFTKSAIEKVYKKYGERLGQEADAREEIIEDLIERGWVRMRRYTNKYWSITILKQTPKIKSLLQQWASNILKGIAGMQGVKEKDPYMPVKIVALNGKTETGFTVQDIANYALTEGKILNSKYKLIIVDSYSSIKTKQDTPMLNEVFENVFEDWRDHKPKHKVPDGTFTKSGEEIAKTLLKVGGSAGEAMKMLTFYINRAGSSPPNKSALDKAKEIIHKKESTKKESITYDSDSLEEGLLGGGEVVSYSQVQSMLKKYANIFPHKSDTSNPERIGNSFSEISGGHIGNVGDETWQKIKNSSRHDFLPRGNLKKTDVYVISKKHPDDLHMMKFEDFLKDKFGLIPKTSGIGDVDHSRFIWVFKNPKKVKFKEG